MAYKVNVIEIRKKMAERRINTISELSSISGINRNTLSKILNEEVRPTSDCMDKLAYCLCMSSSEAGNIFFANDLRDT